MNEVYKIFLTSALTIIGGVIIYSLSQIISKFLIEPINKQAETIGDISDALVYYAREYSSPGRLRREMLDEAHDRLRKLASLLTARTYMIVWYSFFQKIGFVRDLKSVETASRKLIGLSNSVYGGVGDNGIDNTNKANEIRQLLNIPTID